MIERDLFTLYQLQQYLMNKTDVSETCKRIGDFTPLQKIGEGSFSSVYKVKRNKDGKIYALKKVKLSVLSLKQKNNALNQVRILASIRSSFILQYRDAFFDEQRKFLCIVMQWANGGDLQQLIKRQSSLQGVPFSEGEIWRAAIDILEGLHLLHEKGILHRDLKTANIFISSGRYKIGDMNVSKVQGEQDLAFTQTGTPYYASPQIWRDQPYGFKADIWSFGCLIYEMCTFHPPFEAQDMEGLYKKITKGRYKPISQTYSAELSSFIAHCLCKKVEDRPSTNKLLALKSVERKCEQYKIGLHSQLSQFKLLKVINFDQQTVSLPKSTYDDERSKKKKITEQTSAMSQQRQYLPIITSCEKEVKMAPKKKISIKSKQIFQGEKILTMPSQNQNKEVQRVKSQKSLGYYRSQSNSQSHNLISKLPAINLSSNLLGIYNPSTERKEGGQSQPKKQLNIIQQLRRKCQAHKSKLKKVNSSAECKGNKRIDEIRHQYEYRSTQDEKRNRQTEAFTNHLRKMSKRALKKYSSNEMVLHQDTTINKSEIRLNLQLQIQNHRSIHLKKKGKSYKSKIFI